MMKNSIPIAVMASLILTCGCIGNSDYDYKIAFRLDLGPENNENITYQNVRALLSPLNYSVFDESPIIAIEKGLYRFRINLYLEPLRLRGSYFGNYRKSEVDPIKDKIRSQVDIILGNLSLTPLEGSFKWEIEEFNPSEYEHTGAGQGACYLIIIFTILLIIILIVMVTGKQRKRNDNNRSIRIPVSRRQSGK